MDTDEYIVEALRTGLTQTQAWVTYRKLIGTCSEADFYSSWRFWANQVSPQDLPAAAKTVAADVAEMQHQIDGLTIRLGHAVDDLRAANETLNAQYTMVRAQDETLKALDDALSVAERMLAEHEESRSRYQTATGRHLKAA
jgi:hypothetical protein